MLVRNDRARGMVLVAAVVASGCGIDDSSFDQDVCEGGSLRALDAIAPAEPVDYVELRGVSQLPDEIAFDQRRLLDAAGEKCSGANAYGPCAEAFGALPLAPAFTHGHFFSILEVSLAWTRGDEVGAATDEAAALEFLGAIDTPAEAALWLELNRHEVVCDEGDNAGPSEGGFNVLTRTGNGCMEDLRENLSFVDADGEITVLQSVVIKRAAQRNCP